MELDQNPIFTQPLTYRGDFQEISTFQSESNSAAPPATNFRLDQPSISKIPLQELAMTERVIVKQKKQLLEIICGWESKNQYEIYNEQCQLIYQATEESTCWARNCWAGQIRPLTLNITNNLETEEGSPVIVLDRPYACMGFCCPGCLQKIKVFSPVGNLIGSVSEKWGCRPFLHILDEDDILLFIVKCPPLCLASCLCCTIDFPIFLADGETQCGRISKGYGGALTEIFTDATTFEIEFPPASSVNMKALLLGATFLVDYMFFERGQEKSVAGTLLNML
ncbi:unnamed protein product [Orchesella dallaii]|uniref:Phospholipid scramblase n=1 Tax=Orchesella dallaii TaxID=48710 RepID=A0ABP1PHU0_9HEXA